MRLEQANLNKKIHQEVEKNDAEVRFIMNEMDSKAQQHEQDKKVWQQDIEAKYSAQNQKHSTLTQLVSARNMEVKNKEAQLVAMRSQKNNWKAREMELTTQNDVLGKDVAQAVQQKEESSASLEKMVQEKVELVSKLKKMTKQVAKAGQDETVMKEHLATQMKKAQEAMNGMKKDGREHEQKKKKLVDSHKKLKKEFKTLTEEYEKEKSNNKDANMKKSEELMAKKNEADRCKQSLANLMATQQQESKRILDLTSENADLETKLEGMATKQTEWTGEKDYLMKTCDALMGELEELRKKTDTVVDDCETY